MQCLAIVTFSEAFLQNQSFQLDVMELLDKKPLCINIVERLLDAFPFAGKGLQRRLSHEFSRKKNRKLKRNRFSQVY